MEYRTFEKKKKRIFIEHIFCGNRDSWTPLQIVLFQNCLCSHVAWHHYIPTVPDFTVLTDGWSCPVNITLYEAPQNESEKNKLWRLLLTWPFTSPCVNQIFNQKLSLVYCGIFMYFECEYLISVCLMFQEMPVWFLIRRKSFGALPSLLHVFFSAVYWCVMV